MMAYEDDLCDHHVRMTVVLAGLCVSAPEAVCEPHGHLLTAKNSRTHKLFDYSLYPCSVPRGHSNDVMAWKCGLERHVSERFSV